MAFRQWRELTSGDFGDLDPARSIAVLPLAATEQHGPHLPTGTDAIIAEGLLAAAVAHDVGDVEAVVLPVLAVGASQEHGGFAGTLSISTAQLIDTIAGIGASVAAAGLRKLAIVSSHGGNVLAMTAGALECRARHRLLAVHLTWNRLGYPPGLIDERERRLGVHAGLVETALMLQFRPDLVHRDHLKNFRSAQEALSARRERLSAYGPIGFGWLAGDLNPDGVTGNAEAATAEMGAKIAAFQAEAFLQLLREMAAEEVDTLLPADAHPQTSRGKA